jgi:hypothetical protein
MKASKILETGPGAALVQKKKLRYEMGDADVVDRYLFTLAVARNDLKVHYDGTGLAHDLKFAAAALESAASHIVITQGNAVSSASPPRSLPARITLDLPPFLLSRRVFAALKSKGKANFKFEWCDEISEVSVKQKKKVAIVIDGRKTSVPILYCLGSLYDCRLWVLDDNSWPIIVKHEEEDEHFWRLLEAGENLEPDDDDEF